MIDNQSIRVEAQHRRACQRDGLARLDVTGPPLDRGSVARGNRFRKPAFHGLLDGELAFGVPQSTTRFPFA
jgi:hypothetical protein